MVTLYLSKGTAVIKLQGGRHNTYIEALRLHDEGWKVVDKDAYEKLRKEIDKPKNGEA